jgi:hypothetical protein
LPSRDKDSNFSKCGRNKFPICWFWQRLVASQLRQLKINVSQVSGGRFIMGRGILLWLLGIPIPLIIIILLFVR